MNEFWHRFTTNRYWFLGTLFVLLFVILFFWHLIDPEGYVREINSWLQSIKAIFYNILVLVIVGIGIGLIIKGIFGKGSHK
jgi:hypothetical protein